MLREELEKKKQKRLYMIREKDAYSESIRKHAQVLAVHALRELILSAPDRVEPSQSKRMLCEAHYPFGTTTISLTIYF